MRRRTKALAGIAVVAVSIVFIFAPVSERYWPSIFNYGGRIQVHAVATPMYVLLGCGIVYDVNYTFQMGFGNSSNYIQSEWLCGTPPHDH